MTAEGQQMATIIRRDMNIAWQLMPQMNMYMEIPIEKAQVSDMSSGNLHLSDQGRYPDENGR
jgi:hypothetical protein